MKKMKLLVLQQMVEVFIKANRFNMCSCLVLARCNNKLYWDHTEFCLADLVCPEPLVTLKASGVNMEVGKASLLPSLKSASLQSSPTFTTLLF